VARTPKPTQLPSKRWRGRWLDATGKRRSATFATHNDAEAALARERVQARAIATGLAPAPPPRKTFLDLRDAWLTLRATAKRSKDDDESMLRRHLVPTFGNLALTEITFARIEQFKAERQHLAPQTVRHHLDLLGAMLRFAVDLNWLNAIPKIVKPKIRLCSRNYNYFRSASEVRRFLGAARDKSEMHYTLYALALHTGMRKGELAGLTWDRVDFDRRLICVDHSYDGPTKADDLRHVPIDDVLLDILRKWRLKSQDELVFPNRAGNILDEHAEIFVEGFHKTLDAAQFQRPKGSRRAHFLRFHDLRHTFASHFMMRGGNLFDLQKILGHKSTALTLRYAHLSPDHFSRLHGNFADFAAPEREAEVIDLADRREHRVKSAGSRN